MIKANTEGGHRLSLNNTQIVVLYVNRSLGVQARPLIAQRRHI